MKQLPNPGTYTARRNGKMVLAESEHGALLLYIPYILCSTEFNHIDRHMLVLGKKDGTLSDKAVKNLRRIWPEWDGQDPFALEEIEVPEGSEPEFELADCFHDDSYIPQGSTDPMIQFKAEWLNPLGGSQNLPAPIAAEDRKAILTKWGSKFKALSGGKAAASAAAKPAAKAAPAAPAKAAPAPAKAAPTKAASSGPPSRRGSPAVGGHERTATAEEAWEALVAANPDGDSDELGQKFFEAQDGVREGAEGNLTPAEWGKVMDALGL